MCGKHLSLRDRGRKLPHVQPQAGQESWSSSAHFDLGVSKGGVNPQAAGGRRHRMSLSKEGI